MRKSVLLGLAVACAIVLSTGVALADGDLEQGERTWNKWCVTCHSLDPDKKMLGPHLQGMFGRTAGTLEGYNGFSKAMKESGIVWDEEVLNDYLAKPRVFLPGARMFFGGIPSEEERLNLIAYMKQITQ
jgi:cytochrome c